MQQRVKCRQVFAILMQRAFGAVEEKCTILIHMETSVWSKTYTRSHRLYEQYFTSLFLFVAIRTDNCSENK